MAWYQCSFLSKRLVQYVLTACLLNGVSHRGGVPLDRGDGHAVSLPVSGPAAPQPQAGARAGCRLHRGNSRHQAERFASDRAACKIHSWLACLSFHDAHFVSVHHLAFIVKDNGWQSLNAYEQFTICLCILGFPSNVLRKNILLSIQC